MLIREIKALTKVVNIFSKCRIQLKASTKFCKYLGGDESLQQLFKHSTIQSGFGSKKKAIYMLQPIFC